MAVCGLWHTTGLATYFECWTGRCPRVRWEWSLSSSVTIDISSERQITIRWLYQKVKIFNWKLWVYTHSLVQAFRASGFWGGYWCFKLDHKDKIILCNLPVLTSLDYKAFIGLCPIQYSLSVSILNFYFLKNINLMLHSTEGTINGINLEKIFNRIKSQNPPSTGHLGVWTMQWNHERWVLTNSQSWQCNL